MTQATMEEVRAYVSSWLPKRAVKDAKEGHRHGGGVILISAATVSLTLTTSAQSITGDGDSSKVRLLLTSPGDWEVEATCDFSHSVAGGGTAVGELFVNDSASAESAQVLLEQSAVRATVTQRWKVSTTTANTPVELKARKTVAAGTIVASATHTTLTATQVTRGRATSGTSGGVTDHGALTGLGDDDHNTLYLLLSGARAGSTSSAQDFGALGVTLDAVAESTGAAGITLNSDTNVASGKFLTLLTDGSTGGIKFGASGDVLLYRGAANVLYLGSNDGIRGTGTIGGAPIFTTRVGASADDYLGITADGSMRWGDGTSTYDVELSRQAVDVLGMDDGDSFAVNTIIEKTAAAGVTIDGLLIKDGDASVFALLAGRAGGQTLKGGTGGGDSLVLNGPLSIVLQATGNINPQQDMVFTGLSAGNFITATLSGGVTFKCALSDTTLAWGPGSSGVDTNLFRDSANVLRTNDAFIVDGATTLSSTLGVTGLSTLTGGFNSGAVSTINGFLRVGSAVAPTAALDVTGAMIVSSSALISGALDVTGVGQFADTLGATGAVSFSSTLAVTGVSTLTGGIVSSKTGITATQVTVAPTSTMTGASPLTMTDLHLQMQNTSANSGAIDSLLVRLTKSGGVLGSGLTGVTSIIHTTFAKSSTPLIADLRHIFIDPPTSITGAVTAQYGAYIGILAHGTSVAAAIYIAGISATSTNVYGVYIGDVPAGQDRYPIYQAGTNGINTFNAESTFNHRILQGYALEAAGDQAIGITLTGSITGTGQGILLDAVAMLTDSASAILQGLNFLAALSDGTATTAAEVSGISGQAAWAGTGTLTLLQGGLFALSVAGPVTDAYILRATDLGGGGTPTNIFGLHVGALALGTNRYGVYIADNTVGTISEGLHIENTGTYAINVASGLAKFAGNGTRVFELPADATSNNAAQTGRVPILVGGGTKYLYYHDS